MVEKVIVRQAEGGSIVAVDISPNASLTKITGVNEWRKAVQIKVAAQATDGAANRELVRFLSEKLGVSASGIRILRGHTSATKSVFVPLPAEKALKLLGVR